MKNFKYALVISIFLLTLSACGGGGGGGDDSSSNPVSAIPTIVVSGAGTYDMDEDWSVTFSSTGLADGTVSYDIVGGAPDWIRADNLTGELTLDTAYYQYSLPGKYRLTAQATDSSGKTVSATFDLQINAVLTGWWELSNEDYDGSKTTAVVNRSGRVAIFTIENYNSGQDYMGEFCFGQLDVDADSFSGIVDCNLAGDNAGVVTEQVSAKLTSYLQNSETYLKIEILKDDGSVDDLAPLGSAKITTLTPTLIFPYELANPDDVTKDGLYWRFGSSAMVKVNDNTISVVPVDVNNLPSTSLDPVFDPDLTCSFSGDLSRPDQVYRDGYELEPGYSIGIFYDALLDINNCNDTGLPIVNGSLDANAQNAMAWFAPVYNIEKQRHTTFELIFYAEGAGQYKHGTYSLLQVCLNGLPTENIDSLFGANQTDWLYICANY